MKEEFYVIAFESTHYAMMVEKRLKQKYEIQIIPTPREITASCGLSIMFDGENLEGILKELISQKLEKGKLDIYLIEKTYNEKKAKKINWG